MARRQWEREGSWVGDGSSSRDIELWLDDAARLWLAHDGIWFQAVESEFGLATAIKLDEIAMKRFTVIEAQRIKKRLGLEQGGGLNVLRRALEARLYARLNEQVFEEYEDRLVFSMKTCRVQAARKRANLPDFPCKSVGIIEYEEFAREIDPRIKTRCLSCPPERSDMNVWCKWEFILDGS